MQKDTVAAFDFDGTMTYRDSLLPFFSFVEGHVKTYLKLLLAVPYVLGFLLGIKSRQQVKEFVLSKFFGNMPFEQLKSYSLKYAHQKLPHLVVPEAMQRLQWHLSQGHRCILISANLEVYLEPWAKQNGFHDVIASKLKLNGNGHVTGELIGANCWGPEKCRRLEEILGQKKTYKLYVYGDSRGDKELLRLADYPYYREMPLPEKP